MSAPAALVCTLKARNWPNIAKSVSSWQIRYHTKVIRFEGFVSADLLPPGHPGSQEWKLIVRFSSPALLERWLQSEERHWLATEAEELLADGAAFIEEVPDHSEASAHAGITEIIRSEIRPGMEDAYREWTRKTQESQVRFEGFRGVHLIAPPPGQGQEWTTLLRFDSEANLERWRQSPERAALLAEARDFIQGTKVTRLQSPFPGWVPSDPRTGATPPRWKTALLVLVGLYPLVMLNLRYVRPLLPHWDVTVLTLMLNVITVAATTYVTMPLLVSRFGWWLMAGLESKPPARPIPAWKGPLIIAAILLVEVGLFWLTH